MPEKWDADYNESELTDYQRAELQSMARLQQREERRRLAGYMEIPAISIETLLDEFPYFNSLPRDSYIFDEYHGAPDNWCANRMWAVCYTCGFLRFKNSLRETYKCPRCRTRDVVVLRAGEIARIIRHYNTISTPRVGVDMRDIFTARKERMKLNRLAQKESNA